MYSLYSYHRNLRMPETGIGFINYYMLSKFNFINLLSPIDNNTSANILILNLLDNTESKGKISFIPIEFLENFYIKNNKEYNNDILKIKDELIRKEKLLEFFEKNHKFKNNYEALNTLKYKEIPLIYLKKPMLSCTLSKTADYSRLDILNDDFSKIYGSVGVNTNNIININYLTEETFLEWMNNNEIYNVLYPFSIICQKDVRMLPLTNIPVVSEDKHLVSSSFYNSQTKFFWDNVIDEIKNLESNEETIRFIISPIIYNGHFTALIIDLKSPIPKKNNKYFSKLCYFFNSGGYDPTKLKKNNNFWFLDVNMRLHNHKYYHGIQTTKDYLPIEVLTDYLLESLQITNFIFNTFETQHWNSECGQFTTFFLLHFFLTKIEKDKKNERIEIIDFKKNYFPFIFIGDLTMSHYRGLLFISNEDLYYNKISKTYYNNSLTVLNIKNRKFKESMIIFAKNIKNILNKYNDIFTEYNKILKIIKSNYKDYENILTADYYKNIKDDLININL